MTLAVNENDLVFANRSQANWIYALGNESQRESMSFPGDYYSFIQCTNSEPPQYVLQDIYSGIVFYLNLMERQKKGICRMEIPSIISDFYYSTMHLWESFIKANRNEDINTHRGLAKCLNSVIGNLPYPFNINAKIPKKFSKTTNITEDDFQCYLGSNQYPFKIASESLRNRYSSNNKDIILGYLKGSVQFYMGEYKKSFWEKHKISSITSRHRELFNHEIKKKQLNFLDCCFRYRTKAHYRNILCYTHKANYEGWGGTEYLNLDQYIESIIYCLSFSIKSVILFHKSKYGRDKIVDFVSEINNSVYYENKDVINVFLD